MDRQFPNDYSSPTSTPNMDKSMDNYLQECDLQEPLSPASSVSTLTFEPSIDMLVNDFDDEQTLTEEEALAELEDQDPADEIETLQKESEMPLDLLLSKYRHKVEILEKKKKLQRKRPLRLIDSKKLKKPRLNTPPNLHIPEQSSATGSSSIPCTSQQYLAQQYQEEQYAERQYRAQQYPAQQYPAQQYPAQQYPTQQYPAQQYPAQQYPGQQYPAQPYSAQQYPVPMQERKKPLDEQEVIVIEESDDEVEILKTDNASNGGAKEVGYEVEPDTTKQEEDEEEEEEASSLYENPQNGVNGNSTDVDDSDADGGDRGEYSSGDLADVGHDYQDQDIYDTGDGDEIDEANGEEFEEAGEEEFDNVEQGEEEEANDDDDVEEDDDGDDDGDDGNDGADDGDDEYDNNNDDDDDEENINGADYGHEDNVGDYNGYNNHHLDDDFDGGSSEAYYHCDPYRYMPPANYNKLTALALLYPEKYSNISDKIDDDSDDDDDYEDDGYAKRTIMVGAAYQASIPTGLSKYGDVLPYENEDKLIWEPSQVSEQEVEDFLLRVKELNSTPTASEDDDILPSSPVSCTSESDQGLGSTIIKDDEQALHLLVQCGYNFKEALRRKRLNAVPLTGTMSLWSEEECRNFEQGIQNFGKDFLKIRQNQVRTRSIRELVQFYYLWKKTERRDQDFIDSDTIDHMDAYLDEDERDTTSNGGSASGGVTASGGGSAHSGGGGGVGARPIKTSYLVPDQELRPKRRQRKNFSIMNEKNRSEALPSASKAKPNQQKIAPKKNIDSKKKKHLVGRDNLLPEKKSAKKRKNKTSTSILSKKNRPSDPQSSVVAASFTNTNGCVRKF